MFLSTPSVTSPSAKASYHPSVLIPTCGLGYTATPRASVHLDLTSTCNKALVSYIWPRSWQYLFRVWASLFFEIFGVSPFAFQYFQKGDTYNIILTSGSLKSIRRSPIRPHMTIVICYMELVSYSFGTLDTIQPPMPESSHVISLRVSRWSSLHYGFISTTVFGRFLPWMLVQPTCLFFWFRQRLFRLVPMVLPFTLFDLRVVHCSAGWYE
jgi:hypothetical protein